VKSHSRALVVAEAVEAVAVARLRVAERLRLAEHLRLVEHLRLAAQHPLHPLLLRLR
jgi:hypothetical protein